jgi:hypothetical protein
LLLLTAGVAAHLYTLRGTPPAQAPAATTPSPGRGALAAHVAAIVAAPEHAPKRLARLAAALAREAPGPGPVIRDLLATGADGPTGLAFAVHPGGSITAATLQGWLLDAWHRLDPADAAAHALPHALGATTPEAWAIASRNLVNNDRARARTPEARQALDTGLARTDWHANPAFREALDLLALAADAPALERLSALLADNDPGLHHAVLLAADRAATARDDGAITRLASGPPLFTALPGIRGSLLARADSNRPVQAAAVETFLRTAPAAEVASFLSLYPLHNYTTGPALAPIPRPPGLAAIAAADLRALAEVARWQRDPALAAHHAHLTAAAARLGPRAHAIRAAGIAPASPSP